MIRNTVVCVIAVLALGVCVLCSATSVVATSTYVTTNSSASLSSPSASLLSPSASFSSPSASLLSPSASLSSPSASLSSPSASVMSSSASLSSPSASVMSSSASVMSSTSVSTNMAVSTAVQSSLPTRSASSSATPSLSSSLMPLSSVRLSSSIPVVTSSAAFVSITPSHTAVMVTETVHINDDNGTLCLTVILEADFDISYNTTNGTERKTSIPLNGVNSTKDATGSCSYSKNVAHVQFEWNEEGESSPRHTFRMDFNRTNGTWFVPQVKAAFNTTDPRFQNASASEIDATFNATSKFEVNSNKSYVCDAKTSLRLSKNITANLKNVVLQPFSDNENPKKDASHCAADKSKSGDDDDDNTVPIAVGAALGGLVLIVLVAYIIGRRRSNRGYEQV